MKIILSCIVQIIVLSLFPSSSYAQNTSFEFYKFLVKTLGPSWFEVTRASIESYVKKNDLTPLRFDDLEEQTKGELKKCFPPEILQSFIIYDKVPFNNPKTWIGKINWINERFKGVPPAAQTFGNIIYMENFLQWKWESRKCLIHELVHVVQYKELGYNGFKEEYKKGLLETGSYYNIPLEDEAYSYCHTLFQGGIFHTKFHKETSAGEPFLKERPNMKNVLLKIVGNYDPNKERGVWRDTSRAYYKRIISLDYTSDFPMYTEVLNEKFFTENGIENYLCVLSTNSESNSCHACAPSEGFLLLAKGEGGWYERYYELNLTQIGTLGRVPEVKFIQIGNDKIGIVMISGWSGMGLSVNYDAIYVYYHDVFQEATKIYTCEECVKCAAKDYSLKRQYQFIRDANAEYYDIKIKTIGTDYDLQNEKIRTHNEVEVYTFQNGKYQQVRR